MLYLESEGSFKNLKNFLDKMKNRDHLMISLDTYGEMGVAALAAATPVDSGKTASSWYYTIDDDGDNITITWHNDNYTSTGVPIAILIQYGHGTGSGAYVQGRDFINPAIKATFDAIAIKVWDRVRNG